MTAPPPPADPTGSAPGEETTHEERPDDEARPGAEARPNDESRPEIDGRPETEMPPGPETEASGGGPGEAPGDPGDPGDEAPEVDPAIEECLIQFSKSLQKYGLYPADHPAVRPAAGAFHEALQEVLVTRGRLSVGIAPDHLFLPGTGAEGELQVLRSLASNLHDHDLARLTFAPGIDLDEVHAFLGELRHAPQSDEERLGRRSGVTSRWRHISVESVQYERLGLSDEERLDAAEERETRDAQLWLGLARATVADPPEPADADEESVVRPESYSPLVIAAAIEEAAAEEDEEHSAAMARQLLQIAEELERSEEEDVGDLRRRFTKLVEALNAETLQKVLRQGASDEERKEFLLSSAGWLPVGTVVDLVEASAGSDELDVSRWMLGLLAKLARYSESDVSNISREAATALREQARRAITGWRAGGANPERYSDALRDMSRQTAGYLESQQAGPAPDAGRLVQMALELDELNPVAEAAIRKLEEEGRTGEILELLDDAPEESETAAELWRRLASKDAIARLLHATPPDLEAVRRLVQRVGAPAASPMLDLLAESESRSVRGKLFSYLLDLGTEITDEVLSRLEDDRWYVKRNMLALLAGMTSTPDEFAPLAYTRHSHPAVRREAYKLLLEDPENSAEDRNEIILRCLRDGAPRVVSLGFMAIDTAPPDAAVPLILDDLANEDLGEKTRLLGVRALRHVSNPRAVDALVRLCERRHPWMFWKKEMRETSPLVLEALRVLAERWSDRPAAARVLSRAAASEDASIRGASRGKGR